MPIVPLSPNPQDAVRAYGPLPWPEDTPILDFDPFYYTSGVQPPEVPTLFPAGGSSTVYPGPRPGLGMFARLDDGFGDPFYSWLSPDVDPLDVRSACEPYWQVKEWAFD